MSNSAPEFCKNIKIFFEKDIPKFFTESLPDFCKDALKCVSLNVSKLKNWCPFNKNFCECVDCNDCSNKKCCCNCNENIIEN